MSSPHDEPEVLKLVANHDADSISKIVRSRRERLANAIVYEMGKSIVDHYYRRPLRIAREAQRRIISGIIERNDSK